MKLTVIACYHVIPVKCLSFGEAVKVTLGLPFIRTSVDHGTAFDIAGKAWRNIRACWPPSNLQQTSQIGLAKVAGPWKCNESDGRLYRN